MLHKKLLETILYHTELLDKIRSGKIDWNNILEFYGVIHVLQIHAQTIIDYLLHTCSILRISSETPIHCIYELEKIGLIKEDDADLLRKLVKFRNIVVHEYGSIDVRRVMNIIDSQGYKRAYVIIKDLHKKLEESKLLDP